MALPPRKVINVGQAPNDGTGDNLRATGQKANDNFSAMWDALPTAAIERIEQLLVDSGIARDKARDWAEGAGEPGGPGSRSAKAWAAQSQLSATYFSEVDLPGYVGAFVGVNGAVALGINRDNSIEVSGINPRFIGGSPLHSYLKRQSSFWTPGLHFIPFVGQSKQEGSAAGGRFNTTNPYGFRAFGKKSNPAGPDYPLLGTLQAVNGTTSYGGDTVGKEGPMHGARYLGELAEKRDSVLLTEQSLFKLFVANDGTGATDLIYSSINGPNGQAAVSQANRAVARASELNLPVFCRYVAMSQGEGGLQSNANGYGYEGYKNGFKGTAAGYEVTWRGITGSSEPVWMGFTQTNTPTQGGAPIANEDFPIARAQLDAYLDYMVKNAPPVVTVTTSASASNMNPPTITVPANAAILPGMFVVGAGIPGNTFVTAVATAGATTTVTLSVANGGVANNAQMTFVWARVIAVTPEYMVGTFTDNLHYPAREALYLGAYHYLAYYRLVIEKVGWTPCTWVVETSIGDNGVIGNSVFLRGLGVEGSIVIDTDQVPLQVDAAQGMLAGWTFRKLTDLTVQNKVMAVEVFGSYVRVTCASSPKGYEWRYALNQAVNKGPFVGGCGNMRDRAGDFLPPYEGNGVWRKMHKWFFAQKGSIAA